MIFRRMEMKQPMTFRRVCLTTLISGLLLSGTAAQGKEWKSRTITTEGRYEPWKLTLPGASWVFLHPYEWKTCANAWELNANWCYGTGTS